ncbi:hypothetical protein CVT25_005804 [Psilocybe cyanescens]|uniref:Uncharacterized protein n=1 Tax=Psilocybe cyanescens TaxID=93625 RepID=A0A409XA13_PSICY|nr:hypothetical protein CVT25_005804 [Psilocybe cyanescens]
MAENLFSQPTSLNFARKPDNRKTKPRNSEDYPTYRKEYEDAAKSSKFDHDKQGALVAFVWDGGKRYVGGYLYTERSTMVIFDSLSKHEVGEQTYAHDSVQDRVMLQFGDDSTCSVSIRRVVKVTPWDVLSPSAPSNPVVPATGGSARRGGKLWIIF